jgi:1-acyl-sn-glycerol-3-phosphate acyltransferase
MRSRYEEPLVARWCRRAVTLPLVLLAGALALALLPLTLLVGLVRAPFEPKRFATLRVLLFFTAYLVGEVLFIGAAFVQWLVSVPGTPGAWERRRRSIVLLERGWGRLLYEAGRILFKMDITIEGFEVLRAPGPILCYMRHVSVGDTVLAPVWVGGRAGRQIRYVAKSELRRDPVFDLIGTRMRTRFVDRSSNDSAREIEALCELVDDLGPDDAVILYPEGTRFSESKRRRSLERLASKLPPELYAQAVRMEHLMAPRLGGPIALLEKNPGADVVFCVHAGYEGAATFRDLLSGRAIGRRIKVRYHRVPFASLPHGREALCRWLFDEWERLDGWVAAEKPRLDPTLGRAADADRRTVA